MHKVRYSDPFNVDLFDITVRNWMYCNYCIIFHWQSACCFWSNQGQHDMQSFQKVLAQLQSPIPLLQWYGKPGKPATKLDIENLSIRCDDATSFCNPTFQSVNQVAHGFGRLQKSPQPASSRAKSGHVKKQRFHFTLIFNRPASAYLLLNDWYLKSLSIWFQSFILTLVMLKWHYSALDTKPNDWSKWSIKQQFQTVASFFSPFCQAGRRSLGSGNNRSSATWCKACRKMQIQNGNNSFRGNSEIQNSSLPNLASR